MDSRASSKKTSLVTMRWNESIALQVIPSIFKNVYTMFGTDDCRDVSPGEVPVLDPKFITIGRYQQQVTTRLTVRDVGIYAEA